MGLQSCWGGSVHTFKMPSPNSILLNCRTNLVPTEVRRVEISKKKYDNKRNGYVLGWLKAVTSNPSILAVHFNSIYFFISPTWVFLLPSVPNGAEFRNPGNSFGNSGTFHPLVLPSLQRKAGLGSVHITSAHTPLAGTQSCVPAYQHGRLGNIV